MVTKPLYLRIVVDGDIEGRIVQWLTGSFCTGDVEVTPSLLSEMELFLKLLFSNLYLKRQDLQDDGLNSDFPSPRLVYLAILLIARRRDGFILFPRVLVRK